jgi:hypothetical protein
MKIMYCMACGEMRSPEKTGKEFRECGCGNMRVKWLDPQRGRLLILAKNLDVARVIGMNNQMFGLSAEPSPPSDAQWREFHELMCKGADGYIFHAEKRNCWACVVRAGDTTDITWIVVKSDWTPARDGVSIPS